MHHLTRGARLSLGFRTCLPTTSSSSILPRIIPSASRTSVSRRTLHLTPRLSEELRKTALYDFHIDNGGKMVPFAGYSMPLSYEGFVVHNMTQHYIVANHRYVRTVGGIFDVGHMVQSKFNGPTATAFLEWLTPSSLQTLPTYTSTLSVILNEKGGIIDDTVITKHAKDSYYVVTNAGRRDRDLEWIREKLEVWNKSEKAKKEGEVAFEVMEGWGLIALQGPMAAQHLQEYTSYNLSDLTFGKCAYIGIEGFNVHVARGGYTGEDGFEISIPPSQTVELTELLNRSPMELAGLAARDSLRLEAGLCLYGHDLDETTSPVEAGLTWVIGKDRKEKLIGDNLKVNEAMDGGMFIGAEGVREHLLKGAPRRRVGMIVEGPPAREGAQIFTADGSEEVGKVTSGIPSPILGKNIAMAYVRTGLHKKGTEVSVEVRGKKSKAVITPMPFVPTRYYRGVQKATTASQSISSS